MPADLTSSLSEKETETLIQQLKQAKTNHIDWLARLHEHLICKAPLPNNVCEDDAHRHCQFGQWYYGEYSDLIKNKEEFCEMGEAHKQMHDAARDLVLSWQKHEHIELDQYQAFIGQQHHLVNTLSKLHDSLNIVLLSYDNLTGALLREAFMLIFEKEFKQSKRTGSRFCISMLDFDHFKKVNDNYGHLVGDKVLQHTTQVILQELRTYDSLCRYGGEEFIILLPDTSLDEAKQVMERVRERIANEIVYTEDKEQITITISAGITEVDTHINLAKNIDHADTALYKAKTAGRNIIYSH